jgi:hypothetical protein
VERGAANCVCERTFVLRYTRCVRMCSRRERHQPAAAAPAAAAPAVEPIGVAGAA